jgi:hypothetical protein
VILLGQGSPPSEGVNVNKWKRKIAVILVMKVMKMVTNVLLNRSNLRRCLSVCDLDLPQFEVVQPKKWRPRLGFPRRGVGHNLL